MLSSLLQFWRYLPVIAWLAVAGVGAFSFIDLSELGDFTPGGARRTWADKAFPYLFILLIPLGLKFAVVEYLAARANAPLKNAEAGKVRRLQMRQADLKCSDRFPVNPEMREGLLETLNMLRVSGVIRDGEVEDEAFLDAAGTIYLGDSDLQGTAMVLSLYAEAHGQLANACIFPVVAALPDRLVKEMIEGFAALAGRSADLGPVTFSSGGSGSKKSTAHFVLCNVEHTVPFMRPIGEPAIFYESIAECFPVDPPFAAADLDSIFLVTRLSKIGRAELNSKFDPDFAVFEHLRFRTFTSGTP